MTETGGSAPRDEGSIRRHYEIERELADRLRAASRDERLELYREVYNDLFNRVPTHPQLTWKKDPASRLWAVERQVRLIGRFLDAESVVLEIGAGDCALSKALAPTVQRVYALDVSDEIFRDIELPKNVTTVLSDGLNIPVPAATVSVAYSNNLMEHLHPEDAMEQLRNIAVALEPGGKYVCITPNRMSGPHDISRGFDETATGFHLREYSVRELRNLLQEAGFSRVRVLLGGRGRYLSALPLPSELVEWGLERLPGATRRRVARGLLMNAILGIRVVASR